MVGGRQFGANGVDNRYDDTVRIEANHQSLFVKGVQQLQRSYAKVSIYGT